MKLLIRNLDRLTTESDLRALFQEFGEIEYCTLVMDQKTGESKGFGFVSMPVDEAAKIALQKLNNKVLGKNKIKIKKLPLNKARHYAPHLM